jgi:glutaredoxin 3
MKQSVVLYTSPGCPDCAAVRRFLAERAVAFTERDLSDPAVAEEAKRRYGIRVAPITVIGGQALYGTFEQQRRRLEAIGTVNSLPELTLSTRLLHIGLSVGVTLHSCCSRPSWIDRGQASLDLGWTPPASSCTKSTVCCCCL